MTWKHKDSFSSPNKGRCPHCGTPVPRVDPLLYPISKMDYHKCDNCGTELEIKEETQIIVHVTIRGNRGW